MTCEDAKWPVHKDPRPGASPGLVPGIIQWPTFRDGLRQVQTAVLSGSTNFRLNHKPSPKLRIDHSAPVGDEARSRIL